MALSQDLQGGGRAAVVLVSTVDLDDVLLIHTSRRVNASV